MTRPPFHLPVIPDIADSQRQNDWSCTFRFCLCDHLAHVPAVGVNNLVLFGEQVVDFLCLFTRAWQRTTSPRSVINRAAVIMAKLDEHKIAPFHRREYLVPQTFRNESAAAASGAGTIENFYF